MVLKIPPRPPKLPLVVQRLSTDEYTPVPHSAIVDRAVAQVRAEGPKYATRLSQSLGDYWTSRQGTASALRVLDEAWGGGFYNVPPEAALDREAADAALGGDQLVIDIQTHYVASGPVAPYWSTPSLASVRAWLQIGSGVSTNSCGPKRRPGMASLNICVVSSWRARQRSPSSVPGPGALEGERRRMLNNAELTGTSELIERLAGTGRLINHCVVQPNVPGELDQMGQWKEWCRPAGWKVYTLYGAEGVGPTFSTEPAWMLDDEAFGVPFLERVVDTGAQMVCAHKGIGPGTDTGWSGPSSPRDIGPSPRPSPPSISLSTTRVTNPGRETQMGRDRIQTMSPIPGQTGLSRA